MCNVSNNLYWRHGSAIMRRSEDGTILCLLLPEIRHDKKSNQWVARSCEIDREGAGENPKQALAELRDKIQAYFSIHRCTADADSARMHADRLGWSPISHAVFREILTSLIKNTGYLNITTGL